VFFFYIGEATTLGESKSRDWKVAARVVIGSTEACLGFRIHKGSDEATPPRPLLCANSGT
jgi:hypothetical protein